MVNAGKLPVFPSSFLIFNYFEPIAQCAEWDLNKTSKTFTETLTALVLTGISVSKRPFPRSRSSNLWSEISSSNFGAFFEFG